MTDVPTLPGLEPSKPPDPRIARRKAARMAELRADLAEHMRDHQHYAHRAQFARKDGDPCGAAEARSLAYLCVIEAVAACLALDPPDLESARTCLARRVPA